VSIRRLCGFATRRPGLGFPRDPESHLETPVDPADAGSAADCPVSDWPYGLEPGPVAAARTAVPFEARGLSFRLS
jgi:hypothetical protein